MQTYKKLLRHVLANGNVRTDRTGVGTKGVFGYQMRFNLLDGFPVVTTKKIHLKSVFHELVWFLRGDTNIKYLQDNGVNIWNEWADENGDLGPVYGAMWRSWPTDDKNVVIDQIQSAIKTLKNSPDSRRIIVSGWNPAILPDTSKSFVENIASGKQALPPCHTMFQFYTQKIEYTMINGFVGYVLDGRAYTTQYKSMQDIVLLPEHALSCQLYCRSIDLFLGCPFNIASYAALVHVIAHLTNMLPYEFVMTIGDAHIYTNHFDQVKLQLDRVEYASPTLNINPKLNNINDIEYDDFHVIGYQSHHAIKAPIAI